MSNRLDDGYQTLVTLGIYSGSGVTILFWEKSVTPPAVEGGGEIDVTLMANVKYRTKWPKSLKTLGNVSMTVAYDPEIFNDLGMVSADILNVNNLITVTLPDKSTIAFYGFINSFTPGELVEGEQPTAEIEIIPTLTHDTTGAETAPVITPSA